MKKRLLGLLVLIIVSLCGQLLVGEEARAAVVSPSPTPEIVLPTSPLIITALKSTETLTENLINFIQIYNTSDKPINLSGWKVEAQETVDNTQIIKTFTESSGWIAPNNYLNISDESFLKGGDFGFTDSVLDQKLNEVSLVPPPGSYEPHVVTVTSQGDDEFLQRDKLTSSGKFEPQILSGAILYGHGSYDFPPSTNLQISEVLPVSRHCSPAETSQTCGDYIKLYNPTTNSIDLSQFRLRSGYQGQNNSVTNTFSLNGELPSGYYLVVNTRNDGAPLSITNTGGYVWLEDTYGVKMYQPTIVSYPDASSTTKQGLSWAYDSSDGTWKWGVPSPGGANQFPPPEPVKSVSSSSGLKPCHSDQYRNPSTNRCRLISAASSQLKPCRSDQIRNLKTNRCRSIFSAGSSLKPCATDQNRNPATNRCKKTGSSAGSLKPCTKDQQRNPETNRCRKKAAVLAAQSIKDVQAKQKPGQTGWLLGVDAVATISGYGAWEWRSEMFDFGRRLLRIFGKSPPID